MNIDTIMVIDDDLASHMVTENVIHQYDSSIKILKADDGLEALEILDTLEQQPSLILLDINMPRMDGFEFLEEYALRENKSNIIAMYTSSSDERDKNKTAKYPFVKKYFLKPIQVNDLESLKNI